MTADPNGYDMATTDERYATVGLYRYLDPDGCEPLGLDLLPLTTDADAAALLGEGWLHDVRGKACGYTVDASDPWHPAPGPGARLAVTPPPRDAIPGVYVVRRGDAAWWCLSGLLKLYASWLVVRVPGGTTPAAAVRSLPQVPVFERGDEFPREQPAGGAASIFVDQTAAEPGRGFGILIGWGTPEDAPPEAPEAPRDASKH